MFLPGNLAPAKTRRSYGGIELSDEEDENIGDIEDEGIESSQDPQRVSRVRQSVFDDAC